MNVDETDRQLDEMLLRNYAALRQSFPDQRQAVLSGSLQSQLIAPVAFHRIFKRRIVWLTAACLLVVMVAGSFLITHSTGVVYGVETIAKHFLEVPTIRLVGYQIVYGPKDAGQPPHRIPVEYLVKRPDKFRCTWYGVSDNGKKVEIRQGQRYCDGRHEVMVNDTEKTYFTIPVNPLDAEIKVESRAQVFLILAMLGPPKAPYKKISREEYKERTCDVYEAQFVEEDETVIAKFWFDPTSGYPLRVTRDSVQPDGKIQRTMEFEDIELGIPLADELFSFKPPEDYKSLSPMPAKMKAPPPLDIEPTGCGMSGNAKLEAWYALKIADNAALLVWRRSEPEKQADGVSDWLSGITMTLPSHVNKDIRHTWLHQSKSSDHWNWSLVVIADGELPNREEISLKLLATRAEHTIGMLPLQFPDQQLSQIIAEAGRAMLSPETPQPTLPEIRTRARELLKEVGK